MERQYMPDGLAVVGKSTVVVPLPSTDLNVWFHPLETLYSGPLVAAIKGSSNWRQRFMRSSDTNTVYYNPQVLYRPWIKGDGTHYPDAVFTAAKVHPNATAVIDLSVSYLGLARKWCFGPGPANANANPGNNSASYADKCADGSARFNPGLYYRLRSDANGYLQPSVAENYDEFDVNGGGAFARFPARTDCAGASCSANEERQNFANWFVYHRTRLRSAVAGIGEALYGLENRVRLGYGRINTRPTQKGIDGIKVGVLESGVRQWTDERKAQTIGWLNSVQSAGATPLRETLQEIATYFKSEADGGPWSDTPGGSTKTREGQGCRRAYHVLVTDGAWDTGAFDGIPRVAVGDSDGSEGKLITSPDGRTYKYKPTFPYKDSNKDTLADYAMEFWKTDLQPNMPNSVPPSSDNESFWQNITNFIIGFGVRGTLDPAKDLPALTSGKLDWGSEAKSKNLFYFDDLWHAAINSRGAYFSSANAGQLTTALRSSLNTVVGRELREAGVATASSVLEANNRKYVPSYNSGNWTGDVQAYKLDALGQAGVALWSARAELPAWADRKIYTWDNGQTTPKGVAFDVQAMSAASKAVLPADAKALVNYVRGDRSGENATTGFRVRKELLGDFVNSTPVFAKQASDPDLLEMPGIGKTYATYLATVKADRAGVLYVGGNAGMLHGFIDRKAGAGDGKEVFAYVPRAVYGKLQALSSRSYGSAGNDHQYFVDGPLREADVHVRAPGANAPSWRNYLLGSTGAGARAVFALDITDPTALGASSVRWEISSAEQPELGNVFFPIETGRLPDGTWVALFGNGWGGDSATPYLFVVNMDTGVVKTLRVGSAGNNGLGGVAVAKDVEGNIVAAYAGDLSGKLWKFDYDATALSGFKVANAGNALFAADAGQPIIQAPAVFKHSLGGRIVTFGTGQLITVADAASTIVQSLYGIRDNPPELLPMPLTRSNLAVRQLTRFKGTDNSDAQVFFTLDGAPVNWTTQRGWVTDLTTAGFSGLRVTYAPQKVTDRFVLVSAVTPASTTPSCEASSGRGINLLFLVETGQASPKPAFDTNGDGRMGAGDIAAAGYTTNADGVDAVLKGGLVDRPDTASGGGGSGGSGGTCLRASIQNTTGQMATCIDTEPPPNVPPNIKPIKDRVWRRIINPPIR
ncbi:MAG TPA: PilC/PilY family type IV pilus protein [Ramlibacter sp.]|nr:PilC/PilY family type IV pilus protein [Ramlibacter sp.]